MWTVPFFTHDNLKIDFARREVGEVKLPYRFPRQSIVCCCNLPIFGQDYDIGGIVYKRMGT